MTKDASYQSSEVCQLVGITYRQLYTWVQRGYVNPSIHYAYGSGDNHIFSNTDLKLIRRVKAFLDKGYKLSKAVELASQ